MTGGEIKANKVKLSSCPWLAYEYPLPPHLQSYPADPVTTFEALPWAELLRRVFREEVLECNRCGGRRVVVAFLSEGSVVKAILEHLGLPTTSPPVAPARGSAQTEFAPWPDDSPQCQ